MVKYFVEHGADINIKTKNGDTALRFASKKSIINYLKSKK
jgi:ankyrin repeat protein